MQQTIDAINQIIDEQKALGAPGCHLEFDFNHGDLEGIEQYYADNGYVLVIVAHVHSQDVEGLCHACGAIAWEENAKLAMMPIE